MVVNNSMSVETSLATFSTEKNYLDKVDKVVELTFRQIQQFVRQFKDLNKCGTELIHNLSEVYGDEESAQFSPGSLIGELLIPKLQKIQSHWNTHLAQLVDQVEQVTEKSLQEHQSNTLLVKQRVANCETQKDQYLKKNDKWKKQAAKRTDANYLQKKHEIFAEAEVAFTSVLNQVNDDLQAFKEHKTANVDQSLYLLSSLCFSLVPDVSSSYSTALSESRDMLKKSIGANAAYPVPEVEDRKTYLSALLANPFGFRYFRKFLESQHSQENIDFWQAVENFKLLKNQEQLNKQAARIFKHYFSEDNINISGKNKAAISEEMKQTKNRDSNLFNFSQKEVFDGMLDPLERFLKSRAYARMQARLSTYPSTNPLGSSQSLDGSEEEKRPIRRSFFDKRRGTTETTSTPDFSAAKPKPAQLKRDSASRSEGNLTKQALNAERPTSTPPRSRKIGVKRGSVAPPERVPLPNQWLSNSLNMALNITVQGVSGNIPSNPSAPASAPASVASSPQPPSPIKQDNTSPTTPTPSLSNQPTPVPSPRPLERSASMHEEKPMTRSLADSTSSSDSTSVASSTAESSTPFLVKVAFDFKATSEDELELKQGQSVMVIESNHPEWWLGELVGTNKQGYFPSFYVVEEEKKTDDPLAWTYKATVLYDYVKQEENELSVNKGEVLVIYKINNTEEWWEAEDKNGHVGFVPRVYCQVIPASDS